MNFFCNSYTFPVIKLCADADFIFGVWLQVCDFCTAGYCRDGLWFKPSNVVRDLVGVWSLFHSIWFDPGEMNR